LTRGFADTSVGQVHYRAAKPQGAVSTRPLVMFHGSPSSSRSLARLVACLGDQRCVIAFDTMGQGDSCPPPSADVTMQDYARFYGEALDSLRLGHDQVDHHAPNDPPRDQLSAVAVLSVKAAARIEHLFCLCFVRALK